MLEGMDYTVIRWLLQEKIEELETEQHGSKIEKQLLEQYKKTLEKIRILER